MINFKCWYYSEAIKDGNEERLNRIIPDNLPEEIKGFYDIAHKTLEESDENEDIVITTSEN